ncbi:MAG: hypothetical protein J5661_01030 [Bacteroidaceae bacterium]|nr:hypothetical protein [Bacteroidaceae bacterium]
MELILARIAKRKTYTIGKLGILPAASVDVDDGEKRNLFSEDSGIGGLSVYLSMLDMIWAAYCPMAR